MAYNPNNAGKGKGQKQPQNRIDLAIGRIEKNQAGTAFRVPIMVTVILNGQPARKPISIIDDSFQKQQLQTESNGQVTKAIEVSLDRAGEDISFSAQTEEAPFVRCPPKSKKLPDLPKEKEVKLDLTRIAIIEKNHTEISYTLIPRRGKELLKKEPVDVMDLEGVLDRKLFKDTETDDTGRLDMYVPIPDYYLGKQFGLKIVCADEEVIDRVNIPSPKFQNLHSVSQLVNGQVKTTIEGRLVNSSGTPRPNNSISAYRMTGQELAKVKTNDAGYFSFTLDFTEEEVKKGLDVFVAMTTATQVNATIRVTEPKQEPELSFRFIQNTFEAKAASEVRIGYLLSGDKKPEDKIIIWKTDIGSVENGIAKLPLIEKDQVMTVTAHPLYNPTLTQTTTINVKGVRILTVGFGPGTDPNKIHAGQEIEMYLKSEFLKEITPYFSIKNQNSLNGTHWADRNICHYKAPEKIPNDMEVVLEFRASGTPYSTETVIKLRAVRMIYNTDVEQPIHSGEKDVRIAFESRYDIKGLDNYVLELIDPIGQVTADRKRLNPYGDIFMKKSGKIRARSVTDPTNTIEHTIQILPEKCARCGVMYSEIGICPVCKKAGSMKAYINYLEERYCNHCKEDILCEGDNCPNCGEKFKKENKK